MTSPDPVQRAQQSAADKIERMKNNPEAALFGEFEGRSQSGRVTVWVDLLGRVKRVRLAPNSVQEGSEPELNNEFMEACKNAQEEANFLNFDSAEIAHELNSALSAGTGGESPGRQGATQKGAHNETRSTRKDDPWRRTGNADDDWDDWDGDGSFLR